MAKVLTVKFETDALAGDVLVLKATVGEALSRPPRGSVVLVTETEIDGEAALGKAARLVIFLDGEAVRYFHFLIEGVRFEGVHRGHKLRYVFDLAHELTQLELRANVRMFQEQDAKQILAKVLDDAGIPAAHLSYSLHGSLSVRTYCVQHRETDLAFVSRLLEHEGIFWFVHDDESSTHVTFADYQEAFPAIEGDTTIPLLEDDQHGVGLRDFYLETRAVPGRVTVSDYNIESPSHDLTNSKDGATPGADWFEAWAGFQTSEEGEKLAQTWLEAFVARQRLAHGRSECVVLRAGSFFELAGADREGLNIKYLLLDVEHTFTPHAVESLERKTSYENQITAIPFETPYRPARVTPRPTIRGLHSAVVTGPSGSEIHTDDLGRMKTKFFWDREGSDDDKSSCWIRLTQLPIGGSLALGRVGWEMAIAFVDGDPDRPVGVSRLYNAEKVSPYGYPAAKTRMSLQTASSPGGGGTNEIRMEDGAGSMEMFVNASKDLGAKVLNNKTEKVGVNSTIKVGTDTTVTVGGNEAVSIGASLTTSVSSNAGVKVSSNQTIVVGASETVSVSGNLGAVIQGSDSETVGGNQTTLAALGIDKTAKGSYSLTIGGSYMTAGGMGVSFSVAGARSETVGAVKLTASGASVGESVIGAYAATVGGVTVQAAGGNRMGATKGAAAITVGGLANIAAAGKVTITAKKIAINVLGTANLLGGGGLLNLTPASATFGGLITLDASGKIKISGNPNLVG